jgi:hypothetical protein
MIARKLRSYYLSFDESVCEETAANLRESHPEATLDEQCKAATRHFAKKAARDGAVLTLVPWPINALLDYNRTSRHIANLAATTELLQNPDGELAQLTSPSIRDLLLGNEPTDDEVDDALNDVSLLVGLAVAQSVGRRSKIIARKTILGGSVSRWWMRPLVNPLTAAAWSYGELWFAGRLLRSSA